MSFFQKIIDRFKKYTDQDDPLKAPEKAAPAEEIPSLRELIGKADLDSLTQRITEQNVNAEDENLLYPLYYAVTLNRDAVVAYLFSLGAQINTAGENQFDNPIKVIIASGNPKILRAFMENGFILPRLNGTTPQIHSALAVRLKQTLVAKELILMGADFSSIVNQITSLFEQGDLEEIAGAAQSNSTDPAAFFAMFTHEKIVALINSCEPLKGTCAV